MKKPKSHKRGPDSTMLGVTMSKSLKEKVRLAANIERRTMANFSAKELEKAADEVIRQHQAELDRKKSPVQRDFKSVQSPKKSSARC
jgi:uncharacterized protein (DUF1778 family)